MNRVVHSLPLDQVVADRRLRPVSADHVDLIAASMAERGQDTPITVLAASADGRHRLVAGGHRHAAALQLGWARIDAEIIAASELEATLREIDENLMRRELSALDRAVFLAERKRVYEVLHPQTGHGKARKGKEDKLVPFPAVPAFRAEAAARLGLDERSIARIVARAALVADLTPEMRRDLALHPVAESGAELDALLRLKPAQDLGLEQFLAFLASEGERLPTQQKDTAG